VKGKAARSTGENEFLVNTTFLIAAGWREREKKKVITARLEQRRGAVARCVLELIAICVYMFDTSTPPPPSSLPEIRFFFFFFIISIN
jgi:hypothetical protein